MGLTVDGWMDTSRHRLLQQQQGVLQCNMGALDGCPGIVGLLCHRQYALQAQCRSSQYLEGRIKIEISLMTSLLFLAMCTA
jgi:hypothetical protein